MINNKIEPVLRKIISAFIIIMLIVTMCPFYDGIAYAQEGNNENGFVKDISIQINGLNKNSLPGYEFDSQTTEYDIVFPDTRPTSAAFNITIPEEYAEDDSLWYAILIDGVPQTVKGHNKKVAQLTKKQTYIGADLFGTTYAPVGKKTSYTLRVGKYDSDSESFTQYDDYVYNVTRSVTLARNVGDSVGLKITAGDSDRELSPSFDPQIDPYTTEYTAVIGDSESITLTLAAETAGTKIYVGDNEYDSENNTYTVADWQSSSNADVSVFPITLKYECEDGTTLSTSYTLYACKKDLSPKITQNPEDKTVNKGDDNKLEVTVAEQEEGTLSYQWYQGSSLIGGIAIEGATASSYQPSTEYAGTTQYFCVIKNKIGDLTFSTMSEVSKYTVQLGNQLTAPDVKVQPYIEGNNSSAIFVQNQTPTIAVGLKSDTYGNPIEGYPYKITVYRSEKNSTNDEDAVQVNYTQTIGGVGSTTTYQCLLEQQDIVGTYYYYVKVEAYDESGKLTSTTKTSETLRLSFKSASDVIKDLAGTGSATDPFLIEDEDDLKILKSYVEGTNGTTFNFLGQTLAFTQDITLSSNWEPIGSVKAGGREDDRGVSLLSFQGTIDGKNHTLTVADGGKPLFNYVRNATVKNLNIKGTHINGYGLVDKYVVDYGETGKYENNPVKNRVIDIENVTILEGTKILKSGFIGGYASGVKTVNIRNCKIESGVIIGDNGAWGDLGDTSYGYGFISEGFNHKDNIGSFAGAFNGTITNSVSYATVYGRNNVGGLVGMKGQSMGSCDILNSSFQGTIIATGDKVGGIVGAGYISGSAPGTPTVEIHNCYVAAEITGNDKIGGLVGSEEGHENFNDTGDSYGIKGANSISDNHFYGKITAGADAKNIGGILGYVHDFSKKNGEATNFYLDSCGASSGIGGSVEGKMTGVDKYAAAASADDFKVGGDVLTKLNASSTSYQNWELKGENAKYPTTSDAAVVTSLSIETDENWRSEYVLGEDLDLTGITIYANWSDGTKQPLTIGTDVTYSGYDKNTRAFQTITFQYKAIKATIGVTVLKPVTNKDEKITVRFTLYGDKIHNSDKEGETSHTLSSGNLTSRISSESYQLGVNATVWDLLQAVQEKHSTEVKFNNKGNYIDYLYYDETKSSKFNDSTKLAEFTNGKNSGWMYTLNGTHPLLGVEEQFLDNGDRIVWHYTDDYTVEEGSDKWGIPGAAEEEVKTVTTDKSAGTTTSPTDVKVAEKTNADGTKETVATVTVSADNQKEILAQAKSNKSKEIILQVSKDAVKDATKADVQLEKSFIESVVSTGASLTVKTPFGDKTYTNAELKELAANATGKTVSIEIAKSEEQAGDVANIAKAKELVGKIKLVARSSKTSKKNIKVTLKTNKAGSAAISELKDLGYTVKYKYYRSTKKSSKYVGKITKTTKTFTNTKGVKGKKYYYKARVQVYDADGKLVAQTALKQCKYATRQWSK